MAVVNVSRIAAFLNITPRRVQQLVKEGMPCEGRGQYDPIKCAMFYVRYLQNVLEERSAPISEDDSSGERAARIRLLRAKADVKEMQLSSQRSQLVTVKDCDHMVVELNRSTTVRIMEIPPRLAPQLVGETSRTMIQAKIETAIKGSLRLLARPKSGEVEAATTKLKCAPTVKSQ